MSKKKAGEQGNSETNFESALAELEQVVREMEAGNIPLETGLALFERGVELLHQCKKTLEQAELRIRQLVQVDENGQYQLKPFEHRASAMSAGVNEKSLEG
jgi:exodeoxyribonuclease VII small subunit